VASRQTELASFNDAPTVPWVGTHTASATDRPFGLSPRRPMRWRPTPCASGSRAPPGRCGRGPAHELDEPARRAVGELLGRAAVLGVGPGRVEDDGLAATEQRFGAAEQLGVGRRGVRAVVEPSAENRGHARLRVDARQLLAQPVGGEQHRAEPVGDGAAQCGLAGGGQAADQDESHRAVAEVASCELEVGARVLGCVWIALVVAEESDLGPHHRAGGDVVMA
jgi:hypothetical protein